MLTVVSKSSANNPVSQRQPRTAPRRVPLRPLSIEDIFQVQCATLREAFNHRHWPREVIEKFLAQPV